MKIIKKITIYWTALFLINGCAYFPQKPAECSGPYKPINSGMEEVAPVTKQHAH